MALYTELQNRSILRISGAENRAFLQGLITADVVSLAAVQAAYALLLTPQGKYLHDMFVVPEGEDLLLDVAADQADILLKRLQLYKLKRQIHIQKDDAIQCVAMWQAEGEAATLPGVSDPRHTSLGNRLYAAAQHMKDSTNAFEHATWADYEMLRIGLAIPDSSDMVVEKSFPLDFDMDDLHAIHYTKGCYVGQEVTARMHFKAVPKKGIYKIVSMGDDLQSAAVVFASGVEAGVLLSAINHQAIALLNHAAVKRAAAGTVHALVNGVEIPIRCERPRWAKNIDG